MAITVAQSAHNAGNSAFNVTLSTVTAGSCKIGSVLVISGSTPFSSTGDTWTLAKAETVSGSQSARIHIANNSSTSTSIAVAGAQTSSGAALGWVSVATGQSLTSSLVDKTAGTATVSPGTTGATTFAAELFVAISANVSTTPSPVTAPTSPGSPWTDITSQTGTGTLVDNAADVIWQVGSGTTAQSPTFGNSNGTNHGSAIVSFAPAIPPNAPTSPSATVSGSNISVSWTASVTDTTHGPATQYNILRGTTTGSETLLASNQTSPYSDTGCTPGQIYYYKVQAQNADGTANSTEVSNTVPVSAPTGLSASVVGSNIQLTWTAPSGSVASYTILRGTTPGGETSYATGQGPSPYTDTGASPGVTYYYEAEAVGTSGGSSGPSNETSAMVPALTGGSFIPYPRLIAPSYPNWLSRVSPPPSNQGYAAWDLEFNANLSPSGAFAQKQISHNLAGSLGFSGALTKAILTHLVAAVLSFTGAFTKNAGKRFTGALSFSGAITQRSIGKALAGALSFSGSLPRALTHHMTAALSFSGAAVKGVSKFLTPAFLFPGLLSYADSEFETWTGDWSTFPSGSVAQSSAQAHNGVYSMAYTAANNTDDSGPVLTVNGITPGVTYYVTLWVRAATTPQTIHLAFQWYNGGSYNGEVDASAVDSTSAWTQITVVGTAPAGTTNAHFYLNLTASAANEVHYFDTMQVIPSAGSLIKAVGKSLAAGLSFAGSLPRAISHAPTAALSFSGSVTKGVSHGLTGALSFTGSQQRSVGKALTAGLSFAGTLPRAVSHHIVAGLSFSGSQTKAITKTLAGATLSFSGSVAKNAAKTFAGGLSFAGSQRRSVGKALAGGLSFSGSLPRSVAKGMTAGLSFTGSLTKAVSTHLAAAALSFAGSLVSGKAYHLTLTATLSFAGAVTKSVGKTLPGGLSFSGAVARSVNKGLTAALSFAGSLPRAITHHMTAALSFTGAQTRAVSFHLAGALSFTGSLLTGSGHFLTLTASLGFSGSITKNTGHHMTAGLSFAGTLPRAISTHLAGALSFAGAVTKRVGTHLAGSLSFSGSLLAGKAFHLTLTAALGFSGSMNRTVGKGLTAGLSFAGTVTKNVGTHLAAGLSFTGSAVRAVTKTLTAGLSFTGSLVRAISHRLTANLSFSGALTTGRAFFLTLTANLGFNGTVTKNIAKRLSGSLGFIGSLIASLLGKRGPRLAVGAPMSAFAVGAPMAAWRVGVPMPGDRIAISTPDWVVSAPMAAWTVTLLPQTGGNAVDISMLSTEPARAEVEAKLNGVIVDPRQWGVQLALVAEGVDPGSGDWHAGAWETGNPGPPFVAYVMVGPEADLNPGAGSWELWVNVDAGGVNVIKQSGTVTITNP